MHSEFKDADTEGWKDIASQLTAESVSEWPAIRAMIMDRCQAFDSGRFHAPHWFNLRLRQIDPCLQLRWEFYQGCWVVDRFARNLRCWLPVVIWKDDAGRPRPLDNTLLEAIQEGDMWRFPSAQAYLAYKRERAAKVRAENERKGDEKLLDAIDRMSRRQIENFIEVERAFQTGETIEAHGEDYKTLERMNEAGRKARSKGIQPERATAINPGMHPKLLRRDHAHKEN